ncbi:MAG TPA: heterodisulfide reductase subunit B, partial [Armatimonadetes bacterium]|nr:heterodisulfide reductase subunit B [Armatimonadota bacterium]
LLELLHELIVREEFLPERPLEGLKVACYYGCLLLRPPKAVAEDDPENPIKMEEVVRALGAEPIEWPQKTCCCGASAGVTEVPRAERLSRRIVSAAKGKEADLIVAACPLCQVNLETRQGRLGMPVVYISQLVGLALGKGPKEVGLDLLLIDPMPTLRKRGLV